MGRARKPNTGQQGWTTTQQRHPEGWRNVTAENPRDPSLPVRFRGWYRGPDGKVRSKVFDREAAANAWRIERVADINADRWEAPDDSPVLLGDYLAEFIETHDMARSTRVSYELTARLHVPAWLKSKPLRQIRRADAKRMETELRKAGTGERTIKIAKALLSSVLTEAAVEDDLIPANPLLGGRPSRRQKVKAEKPKTRQLTTEEVAAVLEKLDERYRPLVMFAANTGLRFGEIAALRDSRPDPHTGQPDVDLDARVVRVERALTEVGGVLEEGPTKSGESRTVHFSPAVGLALEQYRRWWRKDGEHLFTAPEGGPLRRTTWMRRFWAPACKAAGVKARFHDLRHYAAASAIAVGANPREVMEMLGHGSVSITFDVYGHLFPGAGEALAEKMGKFQFGEAAAK